MLIDSTTTSGGGNYLFTGVAPGDYTVRETNPAGYTSTNDTDTPNDDRIGVTLPVGVDSLGNDFLDTAGALNLPRHQRPGA